MYTPFIIHFHMRNMYDYGMTFHKSVYVSGKNQLSRIEELNYAINEFIQAIETYMLDQICIHYTMTNQCNPIIKFNVESW